MKRAILLLILVFSVGAYAQKISEMPRVTGATLPNTALFPLVDTTETHAQHRNKAILASQLKIYFGIESLHTTIDSLIKNGVGGGTGDTATISALRFSLDSLSDVVAGLYVPGMDTTFHRTETTSGFMKYGDLIEIRQKMDSVRVNLLLALKINTSILNGNANQFINGLGQMATPAGAGDMMKADSNSASPGGYTTPKALTDGLGAKLSQNDTTTGKVATWNWVLSKNYLSSITGTNLDNVFAQNGILIRSDVGTYSVTANNSINWNSGYTYRLTSASGTAPLTLTLTTNALTGSISLANTTTSGYLSSTDWNTFNGKQNAITNLADTSKYFESMDSSGTSGWYRRAYVDALLNAKQNAITNLADTSKYFESMDSSGTTGWYRRAYVNALLNAKQNAITNLADTSKYFESMDSSGTSGWYRRAYVDALLNAKQNAIANLADTSKYFESGDSSGTTGWYRRAYVNALLNSKIDTSQSWLVDTTGYYAAKGDRSKKLAISPTGKVYIIPDSLGAAGAGEANTASNLFGLGVGLFKSKSTYDLQFKRLKSLNTFATWTDNTDSVTIMIDTSKHGSATQSGFLGYDEYVLFNSKQAGSTNLNTYSGITPSANAQTLFAQTFAQMRGSIKAPDSTLSRDTIYSNSLSYLNNGTGTTVVADGGKRMRVNNNTTQNIVRLSNFTGNGVFKTTGNNGTFAVDSSLYRSVISFPLDSSYVNVTDTVWADLPGYTLTVDSISVAPSNAGVAVSIVPKFLYRSAPYQTCTAIITSPGTITSVIAKTWQSTINNATLPADGQVGVLFTTVTTKPKQVSIGIKVKR